MLVLALNGSLRAGSHNGALLDAASELAPAQVEIRRFDGLGEIPPYCEDDEDAGYPAVERLREAVAEADAVLISTPEYNGGIPGALKNALDWASRPFATNPFRGKPVAVVSASTSSFGGLWAQNDLRRVLGTMGARVVDTQLAVPYAHTVRDESGRLAHPETLDGLRAVLASLLAEVPESVPA